MTQPALQSLPYAVQPRTPAPSTPAPALTVIAQRPAPSGDTKGASHVVSDYALLSALGAAIAIVLGLLAPAAARVEGLAAFACAVSFVLLASAPFARHNWQRMLSAVLACTVFALSLFAIHLVPAGPLSLSLAALSALLQIQFSSEHNWRAPGAYWLLFTVTLGVLLLA